MALRGPPGGGSGGAGARGGGVTREAAAYAWIFAHPARPIVILGSQRPDRIAEGARAFDVPFTRAEWFEVLVAARGERLP